MEECIFCKILNNQIPSTAVFENEHATVIVDIHPKAPIHLLAIGKKKKQGRHIISASELSRDDAVFIAGMFEAAIRAAAEKNLKGYKLVFNVGREGGAVIDHIHLHILGGWKNETPTINV